uniref:HTH-type transcriptional repressor YcgE n=1 Tax=Anthurium amnicola TaxID=1678845 RepID=A0A1D1YUG3_9ARAE
MANLKKKEPLPMPHPPAPLYKQRSWSPDSDREEAWQRRKGLYKSRRKEAAGGRLHRLSKSVTDEDLDELRGCIDLGFRFGLDSPVSTATASSDDADRLSDTLPALDLYYAVNRSYSGPVAAGAKCEPSSGVSPAGSPLSIYSPGDSPQQVKRRLKQWAQVVACSVRQHLP